MKILKRISQILEKRPSSVDLKNVKDIYIYKYNTFREVLSHNNKFLESMMVIEEKLPFVEPDEIDNFHKEIVLMSEEVKEMVIKLNQISGGKYSDLLLKLTQINENLEECFKKIFFVLHENKSSVKQNTLAQTSKKTLDIKVPFYRQHKIIIEKGRVASKGIGIGKAFILKSEDNLNIFPAGAVLITKYSSSRYSPVLKNASAVVTDVGAVTVHLAAIAREAGVPMIVNTENATEIIKDGMEITVDAINGIIYDGKIQELEKIIVEQEHEKLTTDFDKELELLWKNIMPLNLTSSEDKDFCAENCKTLHDIARYTHQKVMEEIFGITNEFPAGIKTVKLTGIVPLAIYIIDLGDGISGQGSLKKISKQDILSMPLSAFINGLASIEWPEPRLPDFSGIMGMIARTASMSESEMAQMSEKSFAFISKDYMNFSINLGYHLSVIEALTGNNIIDNYIRFYFKGGGADFQRRIRRVDLIARVLKKLDFNVRITEDIINAILTKDNKESLLNKLDIIGKLTAYTKQLDVVMHDEGSTARHFEKFIKDYFPSC
ncbi:MAG: hypothetical protein HXY52_04055 [Nitrospirae bacterium]|jgi:pyruvate,water dikinase|nr:hypothetical protein [Nitrospirota bacterium]